MSAPASRYYSLAMGFTNLLAAVLLLLICIVNGSSDASNLFVTLIGPLAIAVFTIVSALWMLDACIRQDKELPHRRFLADA